jgi:hypothetical protein
MLLQRPGLMLLQRLGLLLLLQHPVLLPHSDTAYNPDLLKEPSASFF